MRLPKLVRVWRGSEIEHAPLFGKSEQFLVGVLFQIGECDLNLVTVADFDNRL
jgi:hypothetical protein